MNQFPIPSSHTMLSKFCFRSRKAVTCLSLLPSVIFGGALVASQDAAAVTLDMAISERVAFDVSGVNARSYDGPMFNAFDPFLSFTDGMLYRLDTFTGGAAGSKLTFFLASEAACFDGRFPNVANQFGVVNSMGDFVSVVDSATVDPGGMGMITQGANEEFTLALNSPEGLLSSKDQNNPGGAAHVLVMRATSSGTVTIPKPLTRDSSPLQFNLLEGDCILFVDDLIADNNNTFGGLIPLAGDFDYNDMVLVLRKSAVPEPATMLLFGSAGLAFLQRRRSRK